MIPATRPYDARFKKHLNANDGTTTTYYDTKPVIAWDEDGHPLVVGERQLVRASNLPGFMDIDEYESVFMSAIPGGGWQIAWKQDDGTEFIDPVLAWVVDHHGQAKAMSADSTGCVDFFEDGPNARLIPPAATPPPAAP